MEVVPAGRYIIAVSGGVDSVVLLDLMMKLGRVELIVAHFDHGIRPNSGEDARFVKELAARHKVPFEMRREELGAGASEEYARRRRYAFLQQMATQYNASIMTAHHADDVIETIAINLARGTGWRGLAVLDDPEIVRPLLNYRKQQIKNYAQKHQLTWHEDSTNQTDVYLRNRVRRLVSSNLEESAREQLIALWQSQRQLKQLIDEEAVELLPGVAELPRYFFTMIDDASASELLRIACLRTHGRSPTRPQRARALTALKAARPGSTVQLGEQLELRAKQITFSIQQTEKLLQW